MRSLRPQAILSAIVISFLFLAISAIEGVPSSDPNSDSISTTEKAYTSSAGYAQPNDLIIAEAESHLGEPYGYGPGAWRCSEFTQAVIGDALGVWIAGSPAAQLDYGWQPQKTKRGDLLFYSEDGFSITHVAIYMGEGRMIHASTYYGVIATSETRWMEYAYVTARRIR